MKKILKLPNFVSIEYKRHNTSSEKVVQPPNAPPRQNWQARGAEGQPSQVKDGQRSYPRNDARQRNNPTNPAWKPTARPSPINPAAEVSKEAEGGQTSFWVKSLKDKQREAPLSTEASAGAVFVKAEAAAAWRSKDKKPSSADVAKTWARGKSADAVDD